MKLGVPVECTLWRAVISEPVPSDADPGARRQSSLLFVTADVSGQDAIEVLRSPASSIKPLHPGFALLSLERMSDTVRGLAQRVGDAAAWPEPGDAGAAILQVTERQAAVEGELRRRLVLAEALARALGQELFALTRYENFEATYMGGHHAPELLEAFRQGMYTICSAARAAVQRHDLVDAKPAQESESTP